VAVSVVAAPFWYVGEESGDVVGIECFCLEEFVCHCVEGVAVRGEDRFGFAL
jgi:hypothetical protein